MSAALRLSLEQLPFVERWRMYRDTRQGDYAFRSRTRYRAVANILFNLGLNDTHTVVDVGAGECQFGRYLHEQGWRGIYEPIDAVVDGTDLEKWLPAQSADFHVAIEVIEHLHDPMRLVKLMQMFSKEGVVVTTPNPDVVDVIACDPTHVSAVSVKDLQSRWFRTVPVQLFNQPGDTLLAHWRRK